MAMALGRDGRGAPCTAWSWDGRGLSLQSAGPGAASLRSGREESAFEDAGLSARGHGHGEGMDGSIT